jgi:Ca2+-binding EF-hand superfamily protein
VNEESSDEALLAEVQRAFRAVDSDNCGFILETQLAGVRRRVAVM